MLTLKRTTLGLALAGLVLPALVSVLLLGFAAPARADEGGALPAGVQQARPTAKQQALATTASPSVSSSGEGAVAALPAASEQPAQAQREAAASGPSLAQPEAAASVPTRAGQSPAPPPQAIGTDVSQAVEEAIGQASSKGPQQAASVEQGSVAAASNATAQLIWQVETSQCTYGCHGTTQYQSAEQQNTTSQQVTTALAPGGDPGAPLTGERSQVTNSVTQIQYGCLSYCFGTTTTKQPPLAPYGQVLAQLLRQITTALSGLSPAPAVEQSAVEQVSFQSQNAPDGALTQVQSAVQSATTIQSYTTTPMAGPAPLLDGPQVANGEAANQTDQGIWQLQIGCLFLCYETAQFQQAAQANATLQTIASAPGTPASPGASASDIVTQVVWQVQLGCLFWCFDTTEQQTASTRNELTVTYGEGTPAPGAPEASSISSGSEREAAPRPAAAGTPAPPEAQTPPTEQAPAPAGRPGSIGAPPPLPWSPARVRERVAISSETSITTAGSDRLGVWPARPTAARRPAGWGAPRVAPPAGFATGAGDHAGSPRARGTYLQRPGGVPVHLSARRLAPRSGAVAAGAALASSERPTPVPVGVLLAVIALCGVGCLPFALVRTRRRSRASHQGRLTSE